MRVKIEILEAMRKAHRFARWWAFVLGMGTRGRIVGGARLGGQIVELSPFVVSVTS